jgi:hypothetical protein
MITKESQTYVTDKRRVQGKERTGTCPRLVEVIFWVLFIQACGMLAETETENMLQIPPLEVVFTQNSAKVPLLHITATRRQFLAQFHWIVA